MVDSTDEDDWGDFELDVSYEARNVDFEEAYVKIYGNFWFGI